MHSFTVVLLQVVVQSSNDQVTVVGGGITLYHAMMAAETLKAAGINIRVVDLFTVKPIDQETLAACAKATGGRVLTVEDHYPEGTLHQTNTKHLQQHLLMVVFVVVQVASVRR